MLTYEVYLYDPKKDKSSLIGILPERRTNLKRPKGRYTVYQWLMSTYGVDWFEKHRSLIGVFTLEQRDR